MYFDKPYNRSEFIRLIESKIFPTFKRMERPLEFGKSTAYFVDKGITQLGIVELDQKVYILEIEQKSSNDPRITLTKDAFKILEYHGIDHAVVIFHCKDTDSYRLSLLTVTYENWEKKTSSYKRYSYILGTSEKVKTPEKELLHPIKDYEDLRNRFKVEVVRDQFFDEYLELFVRLYKAIQNDKPFVELLESQDVDIVSFTKNLLGKIIFLYFIQQKGWLGLGRNTTTKYGEGNKDFMRIMWQNFKKGESMSTEKTGYFYNDYLERLFFAGLNTDRRDNDDWFPNLQMKVPYLNGGLFKEEYQGWESYITKIDNRIFSNIDEKGEDDADGILDVFDRYNFTIDEDSLYDRDIAVDPEMLGRIFEKMISISAKNINDVVELYDNNKGKGKFHFSNELNKDQGAFYTPREIVHYMTQECLKGYLQYKTKANIETIDKLFEIKEDFLLDKKEIEQFSDEFIKEVDDLLKAVKILDPAVGSGAYPMGLLHEISSLRYYLYGAFYEKFGNEVKNYLEYNEEKRKDVISMYKIKKDIILNNIYGVDIDPGAIDIAKLRFWLSLVVDEQEPEPLPNFEFKFVCANSLVPLTDETKEKDLFAVGDEPKLETLKKYKREYYNSTTKKEKKEIKNKILEYTKVEQGLFSEPTLRARQIEEFGKNFDNPKHKHSFFDSSLMFSEWRGFDIIIANPPYIGEKKHKDIFREVANTKLGEYYMGKMDYFYFFFHHALNLGKNGSMISFITTNYYPTADGAKILRKDFKERSIIKKLINFNELKIFESALGQHNIITILQKGQNNKEKCSIINVNKKGMLGNNFLRIIGGFDEETIYSNLSQEKIYEGEDNYIRLSKQDEKSNESIILNKISGNNELLGSIGNINSGADVTISRIKKNHLKNFSGNFKENDGVFVLTVDEINKLNLTKIENNLLKDYIKNSNIVKFGTSLSTDKLIYLQWEDNIELYPHIEAHLRKFKEILEDQVIRYEESYPRRALHRPREQKIFESKEKIILPYRSKNNIFGYYNKPLYSSRDVFFITEINKDYNIKYLLALLNSKLYFFWLWNKGKRKGDMLELYYTPVSEIPIKKISLNDQKPFIDLVDEIIEKKKDNLETDTSNLEKQIDVMVYKLYGLTDKEIEVVENFNK